MKREPQTPTTSGHVPEPSLFIAGTLRDWAEGIAVTALLCAGIALGTQWLNDGNYWLNLWIALGFGLSICTCIQLAHAGGRSDRPRARTGIGFLAGMLLGFANLSLAVYGSPLALLQPDLATRNGFTLVFSFLVSLAVFSGFYLWYHLQKLRLQSQVNARQLAERDRALAISELRALQSQIEPHFLFNTLANLEALITADAELAREQVRELSSLLRRSLKRSREETTTLGEELDMIEHYLRLQQMRLGERLTFTIDCDASMRTLAFPPLLIQPLVENAIRHGIEPATEGGTIRVQVDPRAGTRLCIRVTNSGRKLSEEPAEPGQGIGLDNVRERLNQLFGASARVEMAVASGEDTLVTLEIPFDRLAEMYDTTGVNPA